MPICWSNLNVLYSKSRVHMCKAGKLLAEFELYHKAPPQQITTTVHHTNFNRFHCSVQMANYLTTAGNLAQLPLKVYHSNDHPYQQDVPFLSCTHTYVAIVAKLLVFCTSASGVITKAKL